jgi:GNAT superfamily N-acetyltransferase
MTIREATPEDIPRLIEMATRFLLDTRYGSLFDNQATPVTIAQLIIQVMAIGVIYVADCQMFTRMVDSDVVEQGDPYLVGMLAIVCLPHPLTGKPYADEIAWWVEPQHRGGSIGPKMLRAAEDWATTNGANMVKMVAPADTTVGKFYERMGYQAVETAYIKTI